jgi:parallel beta-helix repeat protein
MPPVVRLLLPMVLPVLGWSEVLLSPGDNIQRAVDRHPAGTTFVLNAGIYRLQSIKPKDGDTFIGKPGALLSGAELLTKFSRMGDLYVAANQMQEGQLNGSCDGEHPECAHPEDLFIDSRPLKHVGSWDQVKAGTWFFDYVTHKIYFADDPAGHTVETSVTRSAFTGPAAGVTIRGMIIEKYAIPGQFGAIGDQFPGPNWMVEDNEVRWNHGGGINLGSGSSAIHNHVHHNGQKGMTGDGRNILVQDNEISFNNWAGYAPGWEAGGAKFAQMVSLTLRGNSVHDNAGPGLWCDVDCIDVLIENNTVENNTAGPGIQYEISYSAKIRNNTVRNNYVGDSGWLWGAQILIQNSRDVEVYGNTVDVAADRGNGIGIIQQDRGNGAHGPHIAANNYIHNNSITHRGKQGANGEVADFKQEELLQQNNRFDYNNYHVADPDGWHWQWCAPLTWEGLRQHKQELHGTLDPKLPPLR